MWLFFEWTFLVLSGVLFVGSVLRLRATDLKDDEFPARKRMTLLLFLIFTGTAGTIYRDKVPEFSPAYWIFSVLLLPLAAVAAGLVKNLFGDYKR